MFSAKTLRETWINFFLEKGYSDVSNRSVIPPDSDKSLLFINSGVAAIKSYFCGDANLPSSKLVSAQRVIRTGDIDSIGESFRHHTYFEMLGNFSVGKVSRKEAIDLAWQMLVDVLKLDSKKLYVTVFREDEETASMWNKYLPPQRIVLCGKDNNFWDMGVGPCGPCTEIYFDRGEKYDKSGRGIELLAKGIDNERYLEIWNIVFSDFLNVDGKIAVSPTKNLDTGAGMERLLTILQNKENNFETTLFVPVIEYLSRSLDIPVGQKLWAPADYFRTSCILLKDGVTFGNKGREYVLRRIFRKACSSLGKGSFSKDFFRGLVDVIVETLDYYDWSDCKEAIAEELISENQSHIKNKKQAKALLEDLLRDHIKKIPAQDIFNLVTRNGLPLMIIEQVLEENRRWFDKGEYEKLLEEHKQRSFNIQISSAFVKQIPILMEPAVPTEINYCASGIETRVSQIYVGEEFRKFEKEVDEDVNIYVVPEATVVFPVSAGQDSDDGSVLLTDGVGDGQLLHIESSFKAPNGQILHRLGGLKKEIQNRLGSLCNIKISHDPEKRRKLEMNHTAEHILYFLLKSLINPEISRFSGGKQRDYFSLEIKAPADLNKENFDLVRINRELKLVIDKAIDVQIRWGNLDEARAMGIVGNFEEVYEVNKNSLRFVSIGEYGTELCIGTHVRNTAEIEDILITKFTKEQKNIFKFHVVTGSAEVEKVLDGKTKEDYLVFLQKSEELFKQKKVEEQRIFLNNKKQLIEEILHTSEESILFLEKKVEVELAMASFKEIRGYLNNRIAVLYFREGDGYRFFIASNGIDISGVFVSLRQEGAKCGGNSSFGSGMYYGENLLNRFQILMQEIV